MNIRPVPSRARFVPALAMILAAVWSSRAITITNAPVFTPSFQAPLAGVLQLATDIPSRVSVSVNDGTTVWQRNFHNYCSTHSITLLGFKPGRTNSITVTALDKFRNAVTAAQPVCFVTPPLPGDFPNSVLMTNEPAKMEPGYTLFRISNQTDGAAFLTIVDNNGEVVWYSNIPSILDVRRLPNGDLFLPLFSTFEEVDMLGQAVQTWQVPNALDIDYHDGVPTSHNSILYIGDSVQTVPDFPSSTTDPGAPLVTANVFFNTIIEMSTTNGALLNYWSLIDMLQPTRIDYLAFSTGFADEEHANAVLEDPRDDSIIVSLRHQDAIIKFSRATGRLKWILGPHDNWDSAFQPYLLAPVGSPFAWSYAQHGPMLTPQGTLLVYDDGNFRASPFDPGVPDADNYSRAVEYSIDEQKMAVSQVWEYSGTNADRLYTGILGNTDWLPKTGNVLATFGYVEYENGYRPSPIAPGAPMVLIKEVTHDPVPEVVFDLAYFDYGNTNSSYFGYAVYRSHRIPDLYTTLPAPVEDLTVRLGAGIALLQFSGNEANSHTIQASTDLENWEDIGTATDSGGGNYEFSDPFPGGLGVRYYRVLSR
jgi:hypothetical protein